MFSAIASVVAIKWIIEHWIISAAVFVIIVALVVMAGKKRRQRRAAYMALPVLYIGNRDTCVYHSTSCRTLEKANRSNLIAFRTIDEVKRSGYKPCGTCIHNYL